MDLGAAGFRQGGPDGEIVVAGQKAHADPRIRDGSDGGQGVGEPGWDRMLPFPPEFEGVAAQDQIVDVARERAQEGDEIGGADLVVLARSQVQVGQEQRPARFLRTSRKRLDPGREPVLFGADLRFPAGSWALPW